MSDQQCSDQQTADLTVTELVQAAVAGDVRAWDRLVRRYIPLVFSVTRGLRLSGSDAEDVSQTVWMKLVEHLRDIREPRALPMWIVTTTRHEGLRVLTQRGRVVQIDPMTGFQFDVESDLPSVDDQIIRSERRDALREAIGQLEPRDQELLGLLSLDPPLPYSEISIRMGIPIGSIGPTRGRCFDRIRETSAMKRYLAQDVFSGSTGGE